MSWSGWRESALPVGNGGSSLRATSKSCRVNYGGATGVTDLGIKLIFARNMMCLNGHHHVIGLLAVVVVPPLPQPHYREYNFGGKYHHAKWYLLPEIHKWFADNHVDYTIKWSAPNDEFEVTVVDGSDEQNLLCRLKWG